WFIVNVAANWIEEYVFSGFEPGCLQWDIAEKFRNPTGAGLRPWIEAVADSQILLALSEIYEMSGGDGLDITKATELSENLKASLKRFIFNGKSLFDDLATCAKRGG
ncbi:MAG: hypothetical protein D6812_06460, partial [Deltaproteobacteria bacterium]